MKDKSYFALIILWKRHLGARLNIEQFMEMTNTTTLENKMQTDKYSIIYVKSCNHCTKKNYIDVVNIKSDNKAARETVRVPGKPGMHSLVHLMVAAAQHSQQHFQPLLFQMINLQNTSFQGMQETKELVLT